MVVKHQRHVHFAAILWITLGARSPHSLGFETSNVLVPRLGLAKRQSTTRLSVSELHVPAYSQTKHFYLLTNEERGRCTINEKKFTSDDYNSYIPFRESNLLHTTKQPLFTSLECQSIISEAERVASIMAWTKNRHGNFPTTDLPLVELPDTLSLLKVALEERIYPMLRHQFADALPDAGNLRVVDGFVVKYDALGGQTELKPHRDGSVVSFNIALNPADEYEGGGTWFASLRENDGAIKVEQGHMVSHASALLHGGHGITSGKRYIIVAFVILEGYDNWSMRFYNQIRNL
ncbi:hypothetical protein MPSEU_000722300 [Mayamaea pseudoterrestris]|nr:hypothetical protein MPSEU_000722300 [Mayamaea pseudoterrestris]